MEGRARLDRKIGSFISLSLSLPPPPPQLPLLAPGIPCAREQETACKQMSEQDVLCMEFRPNKLTRSLSARSPCAGAALDPPLWTIAPDKALSLSLRVSLCVCLECLIGKQKKPILFKVTECACVYYCRTYDKAVCGGGGGQ